MLDSESGHIAKDADKHDFNGVSGHASGHDVSLLNNKGHYKGQSVSYNANRKDEFDDKGH